MSHILVDQDGVIADWSGTYDAFLDEHYPDLPIPRTIEQRGFDLTAGLNDECRAAVTFVMEHPEFYVRLEPIAGAVDALHGLVDAGHHVSIVTSPWVSNPRCASAKLDWLERHIGPGWARRAVITADKTVVRGDVLIDDKPVVSGNWTPTWRHILFDAPYNRGDDARPSTARVRMTGWGRWRDALGPDGVVNGALERVAA